jgi:hypothetical protein
MFDPYSRWLGIVGGPRPPAPHQILAVAPTEARGHVLEEAALRRVEQVRPYQLKYPEECTSLLSDIASAFEAMQQKQAPVLAPSHEQERPNSTGSLAGTSTIRIVSRQRWARGTVSLLVACLSGEGEGTLTAWKIQLTPLQLSKRRKQALARKLRPRPASDRGARARILSRRGSAVPGRTLVPLIRKGLASVRPWLLPHELAEPK